MSSFTHIRVYSFVLKKFIFLGKFKEFILHLEKKMENRAKIAFHQNYVVGTKI